MRALTRASALSQAVLGPRPRRIVLRDIAQPGVDRLDLEPYEPTAREQEIDEPRALPVRLELQRQEFHDRIGIVLAHIHRLDLQHVVEVQTCARALAGRPFWTAFPAEAAQDRRK